jgi:hypothetical protein
VIGLLCYHTADAGVKGAAQVWTVGGSMDYVIAFEAVVVKPSNNRNI